MVQIVGVARIDDGNAVREHLSRPLKKLDRRQRCIVCGIFAQVQIEDTAWWTLMMNACRHGSIRGDSLLQTVSQRQMGDE